MVNIYIEVMIIFHLQPPLLYFVITKFLFSLFTKRTPKFFSNIKEFGLSVSGISDN